MQHVLTWVKHEVSHQLHGFRMLNREMIAFDPGLYDVLMDHLVISALRVASNTVM